MKTETIANVGKHAFEVAGLGKAPFRYIGMEESVITYPDGTSKAGGCCKYCYTGIRYVFNIRSSDGVVSGVGCDCIAKVGDEGLLKAYKTSPEWRKLQREKREAKGKVARETVDSLIAANRDKLAAMPHPHGFTDRKTGEPLTMLDQVQWMADHCGTSGIIAYAKTLQKIVSTF